MKKKRKNKDAQYFKVVVSEQDNSAEMYLYGYIGQDFWWDEDLAEESITDLAFVRTLRQLESKYNDIHIRINSPGGSVYHGDPIIAAILKSPATIHTYNDGMAASMGFDIWLAGDVRHMSENAKAMIHATGTFAVGNAKQLRREAEMLDKFDSVAVDMLAKALGWDEEETRARFYDYEDHWLTAKDVAELGLIEKVEDYDIETPPMEAEKMSVRDLVKSFGGKVQLSFDEKTARLISTLNGITQETEVQKSADTDTAIESDSTASQPVKVEVEEKEPAAGTAFMTLVEAKSALLGQDEQEEKAVMA